MENGKNTFEATDRRNDLFDWGRSWPAALDRYAKEAERSVDRFFDLANQRGMSALCQVADRLVDVARVNVKSLTGGTEYEVEAPGFEKEDFRIEVLDERLSISATKNSENTVEDQTYVSREFSSSTLNRSIRLPSGLNPAAIKAKYENGILKVFLPIAEKREVNLVKVD